MKQDIKDADAVISLLDPVKNQRDPTHREFHFRVVLKERLSELLKKQKLYRVKPASMFNYTSYLGTHLLSISTRNYLVCKTRCYLLKLCPEMSEFSHSIWSLQEFVSVLSFMTNI